MSSIHIHLKSKYDIKSSSKPGIIKCFQQVYIIRWNLESIPYVIWSNHLHNAPAEIFRRRQNFNVLINKIVCIAQK